jgi:hypothetical protein
MKVKHCRIDNNPSTRGVVQNLRFENFWVQGAASGPYITQDNGDNGFYTGTSKMKISNIAFVNFTGYTLPTKNATATTSCSAVHPCFNIAFQNVDLAASADGAETEAYGTCEYVHSFAWSDWNDWAWMLVMI